MAGKGVCGGKDGVEKGSVNWVSSCSHDLGVVLHERILLTGTNQVAGDFFADEFLEKVEGEKKFDLIYDYTVCHLDFG